MARMLYNNDDLEDITHVYSFIDQYTLNLGIQDVETGTGVVERIVHGCKQDFPYKEGVEKASAFKQVANFVCFFVAERPLLHPFPYELIGDLAVIPNHQNSILAFALAEEALNKATIEKENGKILIANRISYSKHSYMDIIDALSNISPAMHFSLLTVFFEQMVYKTNPECQYEICSQ